MITLSTSLTVNNSRITAYTPYLLHNVRKYKLLIWGATNEMPEKKNRKITFIHEVPLKICSKHNLGLRGTKPVFGVSDKAEIKAVLSAAESS